MSASPRLSFYLRDCRGVHARRRVPLRWASSSRTRPLSRSCLASRTALLP